MRQVETVLVSLDDSGFSRSAIPAAGRLVARLGAGICLPSAVGPADEVDEREAPSWSWSMSPLAGTLGPPSSTRTPPVRSIGRWRR
jgi:hypothetical protein